MERIKEVLAKYKPDDAKKFHDTVDMLCKKGIGNGVYQDYGMLMDVLSILTISEAIIKEGTQK